MADRIAPNPYSPHANADPNVRHLVPSLFGLSPHAGTLSVTACDRMTVVPQETLRDATDALAEGRLADLPEGMCPVCVAVATSPAAGELLDRLPPQPCGECDGTSSQGDMCALCRQDLHATWWANRAGRVEGR